MAELTFLTITAKPEKFFHHFSPLRMVKNLWVHRDLIGQITWREIIGRYRTDTGWDSFSIGGVNVSGV
jgi:hypothetical protein